MNEEKTIYDEMTNAEREVANYLHSINLYWRFENPIFIVDDKNRPRVWTPDFFLPELGIYIEVCGSEKFDYEYRSQIYKKNRINVIFIHHYKHPTNWKEFLRERIVKIQRFRQDKLMDTLMQNGN